MLVVVLVVVSLSAAMPQRAECEDVASCRAAALEAAERQAFEAFHDLAWRAVQKGRPNDPELMFLLARAQSLSGRPGDALVMLRRLAERADVREAMTSEEFARVRALPGWPEVEAAILASGKAAAAPPPALPPEPAPRTAPRAESPGAPAPRGTAVRAAPPKPSPVRAKPEAERPGLAEPEPPASAEPPRAARSAAMPAGEEAVRLPTSALEAVGLAYDSVSRRFVIGDRRENKLIVADEIFKRVNDLISADSAGFGTLTAIEIDRRRGDLWVASSGSPGHASVHKLQLVSGRVLGKVDIPEDWRPAVLSDIAMSDSGDLVLVDSEASRLLLLAPSALLFARSIPLGVGSPVSIAPAGPVVFVAHSGGLSVVDLKSRDVRGIRPGQGVRLNGIRRIRWFQGALIAIQSDPGKGTAGVVRIRMNRAGTVASAVESIDDQLPEDGSVLTIAGSSVYYLARSEEGPAVRRVPLRQQ